MTQNCSDVSDVIVANSTLKKVDLLNALQAVGEKAPKGIFESVGFLALPKPKF